MFVELTMSVRSFVQGKRTRDVDFKWTGLDEAIEFLDLLGSWLDVVGLDSHAGWRFRSRHDAIGIGHTSVLLHRAEGAVGSLATGGNESGIQPVRRKSAGCRFNV